MASIKKTDVVMILTTPSELRALADKMDTFWSTARLGQDLTVERWLDEGITIELVIKQTAMDMNTCGLGNKVSKKN